MGRYLPGRFNLHYSENRCQLWKAVDKNFNRITDGEPT